MIVKTSSAIRYIWDISRYILLYHFVLSTFIYFGHVYYDGLELNLPIGVLSTLGIAISFFLGFRISASYDRWWEARKIWGGVVNYSRSFARQVINLTSSEKEHQKLLITRHVGWLYALKSNLRNDNPIKEAKPYLTEDDQQFLQDKVNVPTQVIMLQAQDLKRAYEAGDMSNYNYIQIDETLNEFYNLQGRCERINSTVFPKEFSILAKIFVISFTTLVPFHLIDAIGIFVIPIAVFEGFVFYALAEIPSLYENPFNNQYQDTPLNAISRTIERDLFQMIEAPEIPPVIELKDGILH